MEGQSLSPGLRQHPGLLLLVVHAVEVRPTSRRPPPRCGRPVRPAAPPAAPRPRSHSQQAPVQALRALPPAATAPGCGCECAHLAASDLGGCRACGRGGPLPRGTIGLAGPRPVTPQRQPSASYPGARTRTAAAVSPCEPAGAGGGRGGRMYKAQEPRALATARGPHDPTCGIPPTRPRPGRPTPRAYDPSASIATAASRAPGKGLLYGTVRKPVRGPRTVVKVRPAAPSPRPLFPLPPPE